MTRDGDRHGATPAGTYESELMARACTVVSRSHTSLAESPDDWTQSVAGDLCDLIEGRVGVMAMIAQWEDAGRRWDTVSLGLAGAYPEGAVRAVQEQARAGWPDDDSSRTVGHAGPVPRTACGGRDRLLGDDVWRGSAFARFRASIGLHDFARAIVPFDDPSGVRVMVLQVDGVSPVWRASTQVVSTLGCILQPALEAFIARFVEPRRVRGRLLEGLSPMQRRIAPLLAEGLTEAEIAERVHRSAHTVHDHTRSIYRTLGVSSRRELRDLWLGR
ncbi:MAG: helix-turn-helix transcriptional regulator [Phycisphaerales bacterium]|nr:helix-turn-helix transcriptional regulator [Phycisphaerales bacterium]